MSELFTLDVCRHGGMAELEEAALTDGQGRALSGHKTGQAYRCYGKETMKRPLAATRMGRRVSSPRMFGPQGILLGDRRDWGQLETTARYTRVATGINRQPRPGSRTMSARVFRMTSPGGFARVK